MTMRRSWSRLSSLSRLVLLLLKLALTLDRWLRWLRQQLGGQQRGGQQPRRQPQPPPQPPPQLMKLAPAVTVVPAVAAAVTAPRLTTPLASTVLIASPAMTLLTLGIAFPPRKDRFPDF